MSCPTGKTEFATWTRAKSVARDQRRRGDGVITPYPCPYGGHFHTGTRMGHRRLSRRARLRWEGE